MRCGATTRNYLGTTLDGCSAARQGRTDLVLAAGDGVLLSAREGFSMTHAGPVRFLGVRLSRLLADSVHSLAAALSRLTPASEISLTSTANSNAGMAPRRRTSVAVLADYLAKRQEGSGEVARVR